MALNIQDPDADRLARVGCANRGDHHRGGRQSLKREGTKAPVRLKDEIMAISRRASRLPRRTGRTPEEIIGYNERGLPRGW